MSGRKKDDGMMGCLAIVFIGIVAMPLVGVYMLVKGNDEQKGIGLVLTIIGLILWIFAFGQS
ncbi:MAG: hypothetical protein PHT76_12740 [Anaerostipes sp.]|nr:hypothetical protein [Anaerostipes sp.]